MRILSRLRRQLFWFVDFLRGGAVKKHLEEVTYILENYNSSRAKDLRNRNLQEILKYASCQTPYYTQFKNFNSLEDFPVIDKNTIRKQSDSFLTPEFKGKKLYTASTSGSTGTPFRVYQDKVKKNRHTADTLYFSENAGYKLGTQLFYMRVWSSVLKKSLLKAWLQNIKMWDVRRLDHEALSGLAVALNTPKEKGIIGSASSLEAFCKFLDQQEASPMDCHINSIIANMDRLDEYTREALKTYFGTPAVSRYSNSENGILAQEVPGETGFKINWASYHIEILEIDSDKPLKTGEYGRVVVTDLFNHSMPMIRYDTGDIACVECDREGVPYLKQVEGRKLDMVFDTGGALISSYLIGSIMMKYRDLAQFQFIQEAQKSYRFKLNTQNGFKAEKQLVDEFKHHLGTDSTIEVEYVHEIPLLDSGKRKQVLNNYTSH